MINYYTTEYKLYWGILKYFKYLDIKILHQIKDDGRYNSSYFIKQRTKEWGLIIGFRLKFTYK